MTESVWTATYAQHGTRRTTGFPTLRSALDFKIEGTDSGTYAVIKITGPNGEVLEGDRLTRMATQYGLARDPELAALGYVMPEELGEWKP